VMSFLGEKHGEFMAVIPVGYAERDSRGPQKRATEVVVRRLD
jgi:hypothetical protein